MCSFKFPLSFFIVCFAVFIGLIILSSATILLHNKMRNLNKEELTARIETKNNLPETSNNEKEVNSAYNLSIEDFRARFDVTRKIYRYSFLLKNNDSKNATASGYIFVILKSEGLGQDQWLAHPHTILTNGIPQNIKDGEPFSITKQKAIRKDISSQYIYDTTAIFIFSNDGKLILEKNFSLKK